MNIEELTGSEIVVESLRSQGIKTVFYYSGGAILPTGDSLGEAGIRLVSPLHEGIAILAAGGYARATGKVGVAIATSGPGGANCTTGVADAKLDSIPVVLMTGQVPTAVIGRDAFQEADMCGIMAPVTKHSSLVHSVKDLPRVLNEAFYIASTGRPGPVHIDIPKDVQISKTVPNFGEPIRLRGYKPEEYYKPDKEALMRAAKAINEAKRPVLYVGGGVVTSGAEKALYNLATKAGIPVTTTLMARQAFPDEHYLGLGMIGMHGTAYANHAVDESDLIIAVGARFDDRVTGDSKKFAPNSKKIHIDIDRAEINKNVPVDIAIIGDAKITLEGLCRMVDGPDRNGWVARINELKNKEEYQLSYEPNGYIKPQDAVKGILEAMPKKSLVVVGVGRHQMWAAQYFRRTNRRSFLSSSGLGTMGFCTPAAIGAQFGLTDIGDYKTQVVAIDGDGSFQQYPQALATIREHDLPIKIFIINDGHHGMVKQWQELIYEGRLTSSKIPKVDYASLGKAYGIEAGVVEMENKQALRESIYHAFKHKGPHLLDLKVYPHEMVLPMIPAGGSIEQMILRQPERADGGFNQTGNI